MLKNLILAPISTKEPVKGIQVSSFSKLEAGSLVRATVFVVEKNIILQVRRSILWTNQACSVHVLIKVTAPKRIK